MERTLIRPRIMDSMQAWWDRYVGPDPLLAPYDGCSWWLPDGRIVQDKGQLTAHEQYYAMPVRTLTLTY